MVGLSREKIAHVGSDDGVLRIGRGLIVGSHLRASGLGIAFAAMIRIIPRHQQLISEKTFVVSRQSLVFSSSKKLY